MQCQINILKMNPAMKIQRRCQLHQWIEAQKERGQKRAKKRLTQRRRSSKLKCIESKKFQRLRTQMEVLMLMNKDLNAFLNTSSEKLLEGTLLCLFSKE